MWCVCHLFTDIIDKLLCIIHLQGPPWLIHNQTSDYIVYFTITSDSQDQCGHWMDIFIFWGCVSVAVSPSALSTPVLLLLPTSHCRHRSIKPSQLAGHPSVRSLACSSQKQKKQQCHFLLSLYEGKPSLTKSQYNIKRFHVMMLSWISQG